VQSVRLWLGKKYNFFYKPVHLFLVPCNKQLMEFTLKNYACSLCKNDETKLLLNKQGFSIVKCNKCGFVYVNPRVHNEQLTEIYKHSYFQNKDYGYTGYEQEKRLRVKNFERWIKDAASYMPVGRNIQALDVGCAAGYCLDVMKEKGWVAEGLELDEEMCESLYQRGDVVFRTALEDFTGTRKYNVITLFDVIEHIPGIDAAFSKLSSLLEPDGIVIMVTPDHKSFQRKILKKKWFQYKPIEHIQYFDRESLQVFSQRNGLSMIYNTRCGQYADAQFIVNRLGYYHFTFLSKIFDKIFSILRLKNKFFYTDTGSLFVIFKKM